MIKRMRIVKRRQRVWKYEGEEGERERAKGGEREGDGKKRERVGETSVGDTVQKKEIKGGRERICVCTECACMC